MPVNWVALRLGTPLTSECRAYFCKRFAVFTLGFDLNVGFEFFSGFVHLGAGLAVGFSGLAAGFAVGIVGDAGVRGTAQQPRLFVGMILILIFAEVLGLYGLIVAIYLYSK